MPVRFSRCGHRSFSQIAIVLVAKSKKKKKRPPATEAAGREKAETNKQTKKDLVRNSQVSCIEMYKVCNALQGGHLISFSVGILSRNSAFGLAPICSFSWPQFLVSRKCDVNRGATDWTGSDDIGRCH